MEIERDLRVPETSRLVQLAARVSELSFSNPLVVVCQDGYQSAVASSWLQANGFDSIQQLLGGIDAYTGSFQRGR